MTIEEWALVAAVAFSGPWSGLLAMLTTILHPMMAAMDGRAFRIFMEAFLRFARKAWFNYVCSRRSSRSWRSGGIGARLPSCSPRSDWVL